MVTKWQPGGKLLKILANATKVSLLNAMRDAFHNRELYFTLHISNVFISGSQLLKSFFLLSFTVCCHLWPCREQNGASVLLNVCKSCLRTRWKLIIDSWLRQRINSTQPHRQVCERRLQQSRASWTALGRHSEPLRLN